MPDKRPVPPANQNIPGSSVRPSPLPIDVRNHIRAREAVGAMLDRQRKVFVTRKSFDDFGQPKSRVLIDGRYYDVNARQLALLQEGARPDDLWGVEEVDESDQP